MNQQKFHKRNNQKAHKLFNFFRHNILVDKILVYLEIKSNILILDNKLLLSNFMRLMKLIIKIVQLQEEKNIK